MEAERLMGTQSPELVWLQFETENSPPCPDPIAPPGAPAKGVLSSTMARDAG